MNSDSLPSEMVLVPREPTPHMLFMAAAVDGQSSKMSRAIWREMIEAALAAHPAFPAAAPPSDLHAAIMNLRCVTAHLKGATFREAYRLGHRDARHAAAELVAAPAAAPQGAQPVLEPAGWLRYEDGKWSFEHNTLYIVDAPKNATLRIAMFAASPADAAPVVPQEVREALQEIRDLVWSGKVRYVEHLGGGIWTWPDRAEAALNAGLTIPATLKAKNV